MGNWLDRHEKWAAGALVLLALVLLALSYIESGEPFNEWLGSLFF